MSTTAATPIPAVVNRKVAQEALAHLRRAIEKMKSLQSTERVLANVERAILNIAPHKFDLKPLINAINALNQAIRSAKEPEILAAHRGVSSALETAVNMLAARDEKVQPYHLRRFCEQSDNLLDLNTIAALTSFYRALPRTENNRGKYDFVVTRMFTSPVPERSARYRHLRSTREQIAKRLSEMCLAWGEKISPELADDPQVSAITRQFADFIAETREIMSLEEMVNRNFFERIRAFKNSIGEHLYIPEITAASVESNVYVTNRFLTLLEIESEEIEETSPELQDLADVFSDTYSNSLQDVAEFTPETQVTAPERQAEIDRVSRLLQVKPVTESDVTVTAAPVSSAPPLPVPPPVAQPQPVSVPVLDTAPIQVLVTPETIQPAPTVTVAPAVTATPMAEIPAFEALDIFVIEIAETQTPNAMEANAPTATTANPPAVAVAISPEAVPVVPATLQDLTQNPAQQTLIKAFLRGSGELQKIDPHHFLAPLPEGSPSELKGEATTRHRAFELIVQADAIITSELAEGCTFQENIEERLESLFSEMGRLNDIAREYVNEARQLGLNAGFDALLQVYNHLMSTQLRLQSAIVRRNAAEQQAQQAQNALQQQAMRTLEEFSPEPSRIKPTREQAKASWLPVNKWLLIGCVVAMLGAAGLRLALLASNQEELHDAPGVVVVQNTQMPHNQIIKQAKIHRDLMVCIVDDQWKQLSQEDRRQKMTTLMNFAKEKGVETVMMLDQQGVNVGVATKDDIKVN